MFSQWVVPSYRLSVVYMNSTITRVTCERLTQFAPNLAKTLSKVLATYVKSLKFPPSKMGPKIDPKVEASVKALSKANLSVRGIQTVIEKSGTHLASAQYITLSIARENDDNQLHQAKELHEMHAPQKRRILPPSRKLIVSLIRRILQANDRSQSNARYPSHMLTPSYIEICVKQC